MYTPTIHLQDLDAMQASSLILQIDASKIYLSSCHLRRAGLVAELTTTLVDSIFVDQFVEPVK
eukprot:m.31444 g.31444  ORF g.31444 m.31444 type:complete len:63 (+) comp12070_c0_seq3:139-327(+)